MALKERLYYDDKLIEEKQNDHVWFVSPSNHKWFRVKKYFYPIIQQIITDNGFINYNNIKQNFEKESNDPLSLSDLESVIDGLLKSSVFFNSINDYQAAVDDFKKNGFKKRQLFKMVYLHLTVRCNYKCWYCYNLHLKKSKNDELNTNQWFEIIDRLQQFNTGLFVFTGGEPMLFQDLPKILRKARDTGARVHLLTNGSLFTEDKIKSVIPLVDSLILSLDSFNKFTQDNNRSAKGFKFIIRLLEYFKENEKERKKVTVRSVITAQNCSDIKEFRKKLKEEYNIENHIYLKFVPNSPDEIQLVPNDSQLEELMEIESIEKMLSPLVSHNVPNFRNRCDACFESIAVNPQGDIYPCHQFLQIPEFKICNILGKNWYEDYLKSPVKEEFANLDIDILQPCNNCSVRYFCGGGCPALALKLYGTLHKYVDYQCAENKKMAISRLLNSNIIKLK